MVDGSDLKALLREAVGIGVLPTSIFGTVTAVDEDEMTCTVEPIDGGAEYLNVLLMANASETGLYLKPTIDSVVLISPLNEVNYYISMCSDIEEVWLRGNEHGGIVKVSELVEKLNNIENDINDLKTVFSTWIPVPNDGGAALKGAAATWYGSQLTPTQDSDIENENVLHG